MCLNELLTSNFGTDMMERRNHGRVKVSHSALYFTNVYPRPTVATAVDLSLGGTRIESPHSLISGEGLEMYIAIHPQVIKCSGEVVHVSDLMDGRPKAGVRFDNLSKQDRLYLGEYISHITEHRALEGFRQDQRMAGGTSRGEMMENERRKYKRVAVDFPVLYTIEEINVLGKALNACNEGLMVECYLPIETAGQILWILGNKLGNNIDLQFTYKNKAYRSEAEIMHFHLDFIRNKQCRSVAGIFMPRI
jgi:hypothetical protein